MPELRKDPVVGRWVIVSTERAKRPSDFRVASEERKPGPCAFCEGHEAETPPEVYAVRREGTLPDTPGWDVRVVPNKYPALGIEGELNPEGVGMCDMMNGVGAHEVIVDTPEHGKDLADLPEEHIAKVMRTYCQRIVDLSGDDRFKYVLIFKNQGRAAGASLQHAHSQLIATPITPKRVREELVGAQEYYNYGAQDITTSGGASSAITSSKRRGSLVKGWWPRRPISSPSLHSPPAFLSRCGSSPSGTPSISLSSRTTR
jgi:UDPglucose--hexose-1-phosphate uridylyltransferase